jgi:non-specific serine/threonine protein kinase
MFAEAHAKARRALGPAYAEEVAVGAALGQERATELVFSLPSSAPKTARFAGLSEREAEVAALVTQGATNRQIADRLVISVKTVENHMAAIFTKTGAKRRAQLAAYFREHELGA